MKTFFIKFCAPTLQMHLHGRSLTKVYEEIGMEALPEEYLPDDYEGPHQGSIQSIVGKYTQNTLSFNVD